MTSLLTKRQLFIIATCIFLVTMSTTLFLIGEDKISADSHDIEAFVLQETEVEDVQNEEFYRELIDNHEDELFILNTESSVLFATPSFLEEFGYEENEVNDKNFFTLIHPKDLPFVANSMLELMQNGEVKENIGPFRLKQKSGSYKLLLGEGLPLKDQHGEIVNIAFTLKDISEPLGDENEESEKISALVNL